MTKREITVDDIVEGMARAATLTRLLTAANITPEQLIALAKGEAVVVPSEPTEAVLDAIVDAANIYDEWGCDKFVDNPRDVYRAMLAALKARP